MGRKIIFVAWLVFFSSLANAQSEKKKLPDVQVNSLEGVKTQTSTWNNQEKPILISFWATWCKPCVEELDAISEVYENWKQETGVRVYAVSIDDSRNTSKIKPLVNGKEWPFEVYNDLNGDLRRAMNVNNVPHTFLLNSKREIVYEHNSYSPGDEEEVFEQIKKLTQVK